VEDSILKKFLVSAAIVLFAFSSVLEADAASKKPGTRSTYSKAQQKKFYDQALKLCRKAYGADLHFVRVDYRKLRYVCYHY
jgi:hypothetical protein